MTNSCNNNDISHHDLYISHHRFTISPLATSFDIIEMRQLIAQWRMAGVSDAQIVKMQLLYFGEPAWMNLDKVYDCTRFIHIVKGMRFKSSTNLIEVMLKCKGFGRIWRNPKEEHTIKNLVAFYSPLWHEAKTAEMTEEKMEDMAAEEKMEDMAAEKKTACLQGGSPPQSDPYILARDIYINKEKDKEKERSSYARGRSEAASLGNNRAGMPQNKMDAKSQAEYDNLVKTIASQTLRNILQDDDSYTHVIQPVNELTQRMAPELYCDMQQKHPMNEATRIFFNDYMYPYLLSHGKKMLSFNTDIGKSIWLKNLINYDFMQKNILRAVNDAKSLLMQSADLMRRQCRPLSPHEYQDKATGQRFYDILDSQGQPTPVRIPQDAPPRPSDTALWDKLLKDWE